MIGSALINDKSVSGTQTKQNRQPRRCRFLSIGL